MDKILPSISMGQSKRLLWMMREKPFVLISLGIMSSGNGADNGA